MNSNYLRNFYLDFIKLIMKSEIADQCERDGLGSFMGIHLDNKEEDKSIICFHFDDACKDEPIDFDKILPRFVKKEGSSFFGDEIAYPFGCNFEDSPRYFGGFKSKNLMLNFFDDLVCVNNSK
jgi:hypothetical protein